MFLIDVARLSTGASVYDYVTSSYGMVSMAHDLIFSWVLNFMEQGHSLRLGVGVH